MQRSRATVSVSCPATLTGSSRLTAAGSFVTKTTRALLAALLVLCAPTADAQGPSGRSAIAPGQEKRQERALPSEFKLRAGAREVTTKRGAKTKRFRLDRSSRTSAGGSPVFAEISTGRPLHFLDGEGRWQRSRGEVRGSGLGGVDSAVQTMPFSVRTSATGLAIGSGDGSAGIRFLTRNRPTRNQNAILTSFAGHPVQWRWEVSDTELKLISRRIGRPQGAADYVFPYELFGGFAPFSVDGEGRLTNGTLTFAAPFLLGNDGRAYDGTTSWLLDGSGVVLRADDTSLPAEAYPYRIDPSVTGQGDLGADVTTIAPFDVYDVQWTHPDWAVTNNNAKAQGAGSRSGRGLLGPARLRLRLHLRRPGKDRRHRGGARSQHGELPVLYGQ